MAPAMLGDIWPVPVPLPKESLSGCGELRALVTGNPGVAVGPRKWPTEMLNYMQKVQHERVWERHGCAARESCSSSGGTVLQALRIPNITRQGLSLSLNPQDPKARISGPVPTSGARQRTRVAYPPPFPHYLSAWVAVSPPHSYGDRQLASLHMTFSGS